MSDGQGLFIVLEGCEGAGKSTLARSLADRIRQAGRDVVVTREPGGTVLGEKMRELLAADDVAPWAEAFAFLLARAQLVEEVIRPAIGAGQVVICDRFAASTYAYQGYGRGLDLTRLRVANTIATDGLQPDLTILLDIDPEAGLRRKGVEDGLVRTGRESLAFHHRVRDGYRELAAAATPGTWVTLGAAADAGDVAAAAWDVVKRRILPRRLGTAPVDHDARGPEAAADDTP